MGKKTRDLQGKAFGAWYALCKERDALKAILKTDIPLTRIREIRDTLRRLNRKITEAYKELEKNNARSN